MCQSVREMIDYANSPEAIRESRRLSSVERMPLRSKKRAVMSRVAVNLNAMEWKPDEEWARKFVALAVQGCLKCFGSGTLLGNKTRLCGCVGRAIFNALHRKYHSIECGYEGVRGSCVPVIVVGGRDSCFTWSRRNEEFAADFCLLAKRTLDLRHYRIFQLHFVEGMNWRYCCDRLKIDRGTFFHSIYRIQESVGIAAVELRPYALYPINEYFGVTLAKSGAFRNHVRSGGGNGFRW